MLMLLGLCGAGWGSAAEPLALPDAGFESPPPLSPAEAVASFRVPAGFRMELVAAEPLLVDPVDVVYDPDGRAYVVEMRGYPLPEKPDEPRPEPISRVRLLFDDDGDGRFDRSTVFVDGLDWPTAVCLWRDGVFVADAPDLWFCRDTNCDGVADERRKLLTGFKRDNVQALVNNLKWGLDHRIYGAASGNGGTLTVVKRPDHPAVAVTRRDFRFDPATVTVEAIAGGARFGHCFDDFGNRFLCNIRNPVQHVVLPLAPLARNPQLLAPATLHDVAASGDTLPVYRISPVEAWREFRARRWVQERSNLPRSELVGAGFFTSSSGVTIYRGGAYPPEFYGNAIVADVAANIVHRQVLEPDGVTFRGRRGEEGVEFVASTDIWFRPVNFVNAPDGTLHIVDMYRENIEHPWSIPDDIRAKLDLTSGSDRGRIWRLVPDGFTAPPPPKLSSATTAELVRHLASPHSWHRETAHRLLWERQDQSAVGPSRELFQTASSAATRLHALYSLNGLGALQFADVGQAATDEPPAVREHAVLLAESRFGDQAEAKSLVIEAARDEVARIRFQAAFALGRWTEPDAVAALADIARRDCGDPWIRTAVLSSVGQTAAPLLQILCDRPDFADPRGAAELMSVLVRTAVADPQQGADGVRRALDSAQGRLPAGLEFAAWSGWATAIKAQPGGVKTFAELTTGDWWPALVQRAATIAADSAADVPLRTQALSLLPHAGWRTADGHLGDLVAARQPQELQLATIRLVGQFAEPAAGAWLIERYRIISPTGRSAAVDLLASRPLWQPLLIEAVEQQRIPAADVPPVRRSLLLNHRDAALKARADALFGAAATSSRQQALDAARGSLSLQPDVTRGVAVFQRECAQCHRLRGVGHEIGPPLASVRNRSPEELLIHILDPNREVGPNYVDHAVTLTDGRVLTGLVANETETGLTLLRAQGVQDQVARGDIEEFVSTGKSLMPEGLEQRLTPQDLADVIAVLRAP
jgi:putative membrane-bound dehydrogenase-like protein